MARHPVSTPSKTRHPDAADQQQQQQQQQQQDGLQRVPTSSMVVRTSSVHGMTNQRAVVMGGTAIERSMVSMGSLAIFAVKPVVTKSRQEQRLFTLYAVHVQNAITGRSWVVHRRYSDFSVLRALIVEHFEEFRSILPRLDELVGELYFPRKHKLRSNTGRVIQHRCDAFLEYLVTLHRLMISRCYMEQQHISELGLSILRGFLGSAIVREPGHVTAYTQPAPIPQFLLTPADRAPVLQCGALKTVLEDDQEYEDWEEEELERQDGTTTTAEGEGEEKAEVPRPAEQMPKKEDADEEPAVDTCDESSIVSDSDMDTMASDQEEEAHARSGRQHHKHLDMHSTKRQGLLGRLLPGSKA